MDAIGQHTISRGAWALILALSLTPTLVAAADDAETGPVLINAGAGPQQLFAYKFTPGLYAHFDVDQTQVVKTQFDGGNEMVVNRMLAQKNFRVVSVDADGSAVLEPMVKKVKMSAKFNDLQPIEYDSELNESAPPQFRDIKAAVGRPVVRMTFAPNGQLQKVTPLPGAPEQVAKSAGKLDATLNFLTVFPKQPIGVGAVWREKFSVPVSAGNGGIAPPVPLQREYTLTKIEGSVATIALKTTLLAPMLPPQAEAQLIQRQLQGTIEFHLERGLLQSHNTRASGQVVEAFGPKTLMQSSLETKEQWIPSPEGVQPATLKEIGAVP